MQDALLKHVAESITEIHLWQKNHKPLDNCAMNL